MNTFNEVFSQRLGRNLPKTNPIPSMNLEARLSNDSRALRLAQIIEEDQRRKNTKAFTQSTSPRLNSLDGDNAQVVADNAGFSLMNPLKAAGSGLLDVATTGLDIISRPAYGTFEALQSGAESLEEDGIDLSFKHGISNPLGILGQLGNALISDPKAVGEASLDAVKGAARGLAGKDKTGFGEVIETTDPDMNIHFKRAFGLIGELGLDPLNYIGVGLIGKAGKGVKGIDGIKDAYRAVAREAAESKGLKTLLDKKVATSVTLPTGAKISPNLPLGKTYLDDVVDAAFEDSVLDISKGLTEGRVIGGELLPATISTKIANSMRTMYFRDFDRGIDKLLRHASGEAPLTSKQLEHLFRTDLKNFEQQILKVFNDEFKKTYKSLDEALADRASRELSTLRTADVFKKAAASFKSDSDKIFTDLQNDIFRKLEGQFYNAPAIKFAGREIATLDRVGRGYAKLRANKLQSPGLKGMSYGRTFPGRTALMNQRLRSLGIRKYEQFHQEVKKVAQTLTLAERKEVTNAILKGIDFTDPRLQAAKEFVQEQYAKIWNEEIAAGVHKLDPEKPFDNFASNYVYLYHRKNKGNQINQLRKNLKKSVKENHALPADALDLARAQGMNPVDDAFEALLLRQIKSNRDLSRSWFMQDLLDHYGMKGSRLSEKAVGDRALVNVKDSLPDHLRRNLNEGEDWYLPGDIAEIYKRYNEIISLGASEEAQALLKMYDRLTRMFKASATLPYPGFHIRNSIGDIFMSSLDGIKFRDYAILNRLRLNARNGAKATIDIDGHEFSYAELHDLFEQNAISGNFMSTDLGVDELVAKVNPNRVWDAARRGSEYRENFFREAHFIRAFRDELPNALKKTRNKEKAVRNAAEAATYRVNKALFDYGALTKVEKTFFRRLIPFYTYSRKSMPTLLEAMLLNPRNLSRVNRWMIDEESRGTSTAFPDMLIPGYAREIGYATISDEKEPWILNASFLPTSVLRENMNFSSLKGFGANILQNTNPMVKAPSELGLGRTAFDGREVESTSDYLAGAAFPFLGPISEWSNKLGGPNLDAIPGLGRFRGDTSKDWSEIGLSNRFALGLPFDKVKESQQAASLYTLTADIKRELSKVSDEIKANGLSIYLSQRNEGTSFRVRDDESGQILFESLDAKAAADYARRANNAKKKFRNG